MAGNAAAEGKARWEEIAEVKRRTLLEAIPREWMIPADKLPPASQLNVTAFPKESGWFTDRELEITTTGAVELVAKLASQTWTAEEVARAFCKAAAAAHQLV
jgi:amidase